MHVWHDGGSRESDPIREQESIPTENCNICKTESLYSRHLDHDMGQGSNSSPVLCLPMPVSISPNIIATPVISITSVT